MDNADRIMHTVITNAAADLGLIAERTWTRADAEADIADAVAELRTHPGVISATGALTSWDDACLSGVGEIDVTMQPNIQRVDLILSVGVGVMVNVRDEEPAP